MKYMSTWKMKKREQKIFDILDLISFIVVVGVIAIMVHAGVQYQVMHGVR